MTQSRRLFSLVELLAVITVIAILFSLLMPSIRKAHKQALTSNCQNNLRQCGIALNTYALTYRGGLRSGKDDAGNQSPHTADQLFGILTAGRYIPAGKSTSCPACPVASSAWGGYGARIYLGTVSQIGNVWFAGCSYKNNGFYPKMVPNNTSYAEPLLTHERRSNLLYTDGRVELLSPVGLKTRGFNNAWFGDYGSTLVRNSL